MLLVKNVNKYLIQWNHQYLSIYVVEVDFIFGFCYLYRGISRSIGRGLLGLNQFCIQILMGRILRHLGINYQNTLELGIGMG